MDRRTFLSTLPASVLVASSSSSNGQLTADGRGNIPSEPIAVGSHRQLFLDDFYFASQQNVRLTVHRPVLREPVISCDQPWEKKLIHYSSVLLDSGKYRLWYRVDDDGDPSRDDSAARTLICYAESGDGVHWQKPHLGLVSWNGSRQNNIVFPSDSIPGGNGCCVLLHESAPADERYKMITAQSTQDVWGYVSGDGVHWKRAADRPLFDPAYWGFDSHNVLQWDEESGLYVIYCRGWVEESGGIVGSARAHAPTFDFKHMYRVIRRSESADFRSWSEPQVVVAPDADDPPGFDFYTNAAVKYFRAQRAWLMFPMVLNEGGRRGPEAPYPGLSDIQFASSRDGILWERRFRRPYIAPGPDNRNWVDRNPIMGVGIIPTGAGELSLYYSELYRSPETRLRRATLRTDGFVSVEGPYAGWGEFTTHPLVFQGDQLELNYSTSSGGSIRVELQDQAGRAHPGFSLDESPDLFGDEIDGAVKWKSDGNLGLLAGTPIRLRVRLRDADLFAFRFRNV